MQITDSHCHFDFAAFGPAQGSGAKQERAAHWCRAQAAGVHRLVMPGVEPVQWPLLPELCGEHQGLYYALGVHPWWLEESATDWPQQLDLALQRAVTDSLCVAVGEIGLDKHLSVPQAQQNYGYISSYCIF